MNTEVVIGDEEDEKASTPERVDELPPEGHEEEPQEPAEVEGEPEDKEEVEEKPKKRHGNTAKERISELVKRGYQYEDQIRELQYQLQNRDQELIQAQQAATRHFDDSVTLQLDKAKQLKRQALESGDLDAITEADVALASAASAVQQAQLLKQQQKRYEEDYEYQNNYAEDTQESQRELQNFQRQHSWYYPDAPNYNERLATKLRTEVDIFEQKLRDRGMGHLIGKAPYFQEINRYIASELFVDDEPTERRQVRMKPQGYTTTAPGRTSGRLPVQKETRRLTQDEREMGRRAGAKSDEEILKAIMDDERETGRRRR